MEMILRITMMSLVEPIESLDDITTICSPATGNRYVIILVGEVFGLLIVNFLLQTIELIFEFSLLLQRFFQPFLELFIRIHRGLL